MRKSFAFWRSWRTSKISTGRFRSHASHALLMSNLQAYVVYQAGLNGAAGGPNFMLLDMFGSHRTTEILEIIACGRSRSEGVSW